MAVKRFVEILAWKKAHEFVLQIYKLSKNFPKSETFGITNQIQRSAVSIASNIAEGFKRKSKKDCLHFYNIAQSSLEEAKYQLILAKDLKYILQKQYDLAFTLADETGKILNGWIKSRKQLTTDH